MVVKLFINGYGNIGRRIALAFTKDKDIHLIGVAKYTCDSKTREAIENKFNVYVSHEMTKLFKERGYTITGEIPEAIEQSDLIIDASKEGEGFNNKKNYYEPKKKSAIFQGGEERYGKHSVADIIHNSRVNYESMGGRKYVIQGSCNVSGMGRIMQPLIENFSNIKRYDVTLIRRSADLEDMREVKDSIEWDKNPHHQDDVKDFIPSANLYVESYKVPSRMMHLHQIAVRFDGKAPNKDSLLEIFQNEFGVAILNSAKGTADIRRKAIDLDFPNGDTNMVHIHQDMLRIQDDTVKISYSDDQTGMVIPENYLLMQSMIYRRPRSQAIRNTDKLFQMNKKRKILEEEFK